MCVCVCVCRVSGERGAGYHLIVLKIEYLEILIPYSTPKYLPFTCLHIFRYSIDMRIHEKEDR